VSSSSLSNLTTTIIIVKNVLLLQGPHVLSIFNHCFQFVFSRIRIGFALLDPDKDWDCGFWIQSNETEKKMVFQPFLGVFYDLLRNSEHIRIRIRIRTVCLIVGPINPDPDGHRLGSGTLLETRTRHIVSSMTKNSIVDRQPPLSLRAPCLQPSL
jgi:hypothetical protein